MIPRLLALATVMPRWLLLAGSVAVSVASHTAAWRLGAAHEFRAGYSAGQTAATARHRAAADARIARQLQDRLDAETASHPPLRSDGLRCGPSARDCPDSE